VDHFLVHCCYAKEVWFESFRDANVPYAQPSVGDSLEDWWLAARQRIQVRERSGFDARIMLTCWSIWKQRNARVFQNSNQCSAMELARRIKDELTLWRLARARVGVGGSFRTLGE
jgi:hypothetical protein